jgi:hypothetical protein
MVLTPEQYLQIAAAYGKAATDYTVPPPLRNAFGRKAEWFRMLAQVAAKFGMPPQERCVNDNSDLQIRPKAHHLSGWTPHSLMELKR